MARRALHVSLRKSARRTAGLVVNEVSLYGNSGGDCGVIQGLVAYLLVVGGRTSPRGGVRPRLTATWLSVVVAMAACGTVIRPPEPDRRLAVHAQGTIFDVDRGYRFVVLPEPDSSLVRVDVRYPVGSIDDPVGKEGLAHLVEHLLSEAEVSRDGTRTSIDGELATVALSFNAYTTTDATTYEARALPAALDDLVRIEAERITIGCTGIPRELFEREREVVRNELRERAGGGGSQLRRAIHEAIYPEGHPYRRVDSSETVAAITYEDVCAFIVGPYRRGTPIIAISGAVDAAMVQQAVTNRFAHVPKRVPAVASAIAPAPVQGGTVKLRGAVDEPTLLVTWPLPPMASTDYRLLELAWPHIASNLEDYAFLYHWGHSASSQILGGPRAPVLALSIVLDSASDFDEAKGRLGSALRDTYYQIAQPGAEPTGAGWVHTWERRAASLIARWESLEGRNELSSDFQQYEPNGSIIARIKELSSSTPLHVRALAESWFTEARARFVLIEPTNTSSVGSGSVFQGVVEQHGARVDRTLADQPLPPLHASAPLQTERYTQSNGLAVVLAKGTGAPLAYARLVVDAGAADAPFGKEGVAYTVGASDVYADSMVFGERSLSIRVDDLIASVSSELRLPGYGLTDEQKKYLIARLSQPRVVERDAYDTEIRLALYGEGHAYARSSMSAAGVKHLSQDVVEDWARSQITPNNSTLVIVGAFDPALIKRHIAFNTDQVSAGSHTRDVKTPPRTSPGFVVGVTAKPSPTVELAAYFVGGRGVDDDYPKRLVLEAVLDAQLAQLREKRALTYGFAASYEPRRAGGIWTIAGNVDAARAVEAGQAIINILDELRRDPEVYRGAFVLGRQKVLESLLVNVASTEAVAARLAFMARFGLDDDYFNTVATAVARLTLPDLQAFLVRELAVDHQVIGAFGNPGPANAAISAARAVKPSAQSTIVDPFQ
ncbi:MAG: peptidase domain protein [Myxococcales bacterium]|nr:peptidase domain protein [Myxococcales bacterium]